MTKNTKIGGRFFAALPKANRGPGGWRCSCCRIGRLADHKRMAHRIERRAAHQSERMVLRDATAPEFLT